jgi:hypothetical protein
MNINTVAKSEHYHYVGSYEQVKYDYKVLDYSDGKDYFTYTVNPKSKLKYSITHGDRMQYLNKDKRYILKVSKDKTAQQIDDIILKSLKVFASI